MAKFSLSGKTQAYICGSNAFMLNTPLMHNPYHPDSEEFVEFQRGWNDTAEKCVEPISASDWGPQE